MDEEYQRRIHKHHRTVAEAEHQLLEIAQRLCPGGHWLLQIEARREFIGDGTDVSVFQREYLAVAHNGADNVTARGKTPGAAVAQLIHYLLNGAVFPLTGNGGRFYRDAWERDIEQARASTEMGRKGKSDGSR